VHGFKEVGTTTTPFDMVMLNDLDRYRLAIDVIDRVSGLADRARDVRARMIEQRAAARAWTRAHGDDIPSVRDWVWPAG
jgi:xylulose-5-phosphate/fructose-6-phosphate phosphoketolase